MKNVKQKTKINRLCTLQKFQNIKNIEEEKITITKHAIYRAHLFHLRLEITILACVLDCLSPLKRCWSRLEYAGIGLNRLE